MKNLTGDALKTIRILLNESQQSFAKRLNVTTMYYKFQELQMDTFIDSATARKVREIAKNEIYKRERLIANLERSLR